MSLVGLLDNLLFKSLLQIYDNVFGHVFMALGSVGLTIIWFSLCVNLVLSPLYYQMERAKGAGAERREAMEREADRMKQHYHGRELYYYLQTLHRVYGYKPIAALFASSDLYLQILVFSTVYRYLAHHPALRQEQFMSIADLSKPDGLLFGLNLLPILMTLLNALSTLLYTDDKKKQRTGFGIAVVFLVLLYRSPAGVVLYWTCNNAFSLVRNLFAKRVVPQLSDEMTIKLARLANQE